ncbi:MAG TPA: DUF6647 family protein [Burkholderiales bacterium]|nr:DUF6647 family protein [Burkholderiales bacterium]
MDAHALGELVAELFVAIHALSAYPVPQAGPEIHSVPLEVMQQKLCGKPCAVKAFYHPQWGVYLDEKLDLRDNAFDRSVLLHELVHFMQKTTGRFEKAPGACQRNYLSEVEAYEIQNLYLASVNSPTRALYAGWTMACKDEAGKS